MDSGWRCLFTNAHVMGSVLSKHSVLECITASGKCRGRFNIRISIREAGQMAQLVRYPLFKNEDLSVVVWFCNPRAGRVDRGHKF